MSKKTITVVFTTERDETISLYGIFSTKEKACKSIEREISIGKVVYLDPDGNEHLTGPLSEYEGWEIIGLNNADPHGDADEDENDINDVWGYMITDTIQ